jgi:hypothetical protein
MEGYEVYVLVPPTPSISSALRPVVADAAGKAGFVCGEVTDLCAAVDDLVSVLAGARHRTVVHVVIDGDRVIVRGSTRPQHGESLPDPPSGRALLVDAAAARAHFETTTTRSGFTISGRARRVGV